MNRLSDATKFKLLLGTAAALACLAVAYTAASDRLLPDLEGYLARRSHYERVIAPKGLGLHEAVFWKER